VLRLLARGADTPKVSKALGIPVPEVRRHLAAALTHYKAANATHAVALAIAAEDLPRDAATTQE
jgi:hypothetical protein